MEKCENYDNCPFLKEYQGDSTYATAVKGLEKHFCLEKRDKICIRKLVVKEKAGMSVPYNMMPNGYHAPGSDMKAWNEEMFQLLHKLYC